MFKQIHVFIRLGTNIISMLLIALVMFTVHHDIAQASSWEQCGGAATISGTVIDPDGNPLSGIIVEARVGADVACPTAVTDDAGAFTIEDLPADEWTLSFESRIDAQNRYGSPEPIVITVTDDETVSLADSVQMQQPAAFVQIVVPGTEVSSERTYSGQLVFNPYGTTQNDNGQNDSEGCGEIAFYGPAAVRAFFYGQETVYLPNIAPGTYCMYAEISDYDSISTAQQFGAAYQAPAPRVVEIPTVSELVDPELVDLGAITFGLPAKRITVSVVDEEGIGAAGVYVRATQGDDDVTVDAMTDQSGEAILAVSHGSWDVELQPKPNIDLADTTSQIIDFAANNSTETATMQVQGQRIHSAITGRLVQNDGTPLPADAEWDRIRMTAWTIDGSGNYDAQLDESGSFSVTVPAGAYKIITYAVILAERGLFSPPPFTVTVESDQVTAISDVKMTPTQITAIVQDEDGNPLADTYYRIIVNGTPDRLGNTDCTNTYAIKDDFPPRTPVVVSGGGDDNGLLQIGGLPSGEYCLIVRYNISAPLANSYYGRVTSVVTIGSEESDESTVDLGTLVAETRNKRLTGRITQPDGTGLPNASVRAQSNSDRGWSTVVTAADGSYEFDLEQGEWAISIGENAPYGPVILNDVTHLNRKWFVDNTSQTVPFANDETAETQQLDWALPDISATISGTIRKPDGTPATGLENVLVIAHSSDWATDPETGRDTLLYARVDSTTGSYTLPVVGGQWRVRYQVTGEYQSENNPVIYGQSSGTVSLTIDNGETLEQDFTLVSLGATIRGQLLNADGSPVAYGVVNVRSIANTSPNAISERRIEVFNGTFEVNVEADGVYNIDTRSPLISHPLYNNPPKQTITATANDPATVTIQLAALDVEVTERLLHLPLMFQP